MDISIRNWGAVDAAAHIRVPVKTDNKYSHGVLGVITGSKMYPGAAVLGVEAAHRTGIGMVRFLGSATAADLVLNRRPEVVTVPGEVNAWLIGSGLDEAGIAEQQECISFALVSGQPVVLDAGALGFERESVGPVIVTPHSGELERLVPRARVVDGALEDEACWAGRAADELGSVVLLKGNTSYISWPQGEVARHEVIAVESPTTWLATAGTGDVLAGIIGALVAVTAVERKLDLEALAKLAATGSLIHGQAANLAAKKGPFPALDVAEAVSMQVAELFTERS